MLRLFPLLVLTCVPLLAQTPVAGPTPTFALADVHPSPWVNYPYLHGGTLHGDRYTLRQATMVDLIANAYSIDPKTIQGGPSWLEFDRFDIVARAPGGTPAATLKLMLRSLLTERFGLVVHKGVAPMPAWILTAVKPKLAESPGGTTACGPVAPAVMTAVAVACRNMSMDQFAPLLQGFGGGYLHDQPVVDATGLSDKYDFEFQWTPSAVLPRAGPDGITIFDAMEKQLGLKLDLQTAPRPALIVDQVNRIPTPNAPDIAKALPPEPPAHFEVAVIKPSRPGQPEVGMSDRDRLDLRGSLKYLIQSAWNLDLNDDEDVLGLPKWGDSDRYDVQAKASADDLVQTARGRQVENEEMNQMLRTLLIERFGIEAHMEERPVDAYNFEAAGPKLAPKLQPTNPAERTRCTEGPAPGEKDPRTTTPVLNLVFHCQNITIAEFGRVLPSFDYGSLYSPVLDETGFQGRYDFTLSFSSADRLESGSGDIHAAAGSQNTSLAPGDPNGALSLNDALRRQLGLRLEKVRRPAPVLVIDHINRQPTAN